MFKSKLLNLVLAFVIAFGLWAYVITFVSSEREETFYDIPVSYQNDEFVTISDTKVVVTYGGVSVDVAISVSKIELNNPQILGEYTYTGLDQTANIKQTTY